jgi:hypothetical protein
LDVDWTLLHVKYSSQRMDNILVCYQFKYILFRGDVFVFR